MADTTTKLPALTTEFVPASSCTELVMLSGNAFRRTGGECYPNDSIGYQYSPSACPPGWTYEPNAAQLTIAGATATATQTQALYCPRYDMTLPKPFLSKTQRWI
jgi:hypothetical protein